MLIDLEFTDKYLENKSHILEFNTDDGGLFVRAKMKFQDGTEKLIECKLCTRLDKGIYAANNFHHIIDSYTEYDEYTIEKERELYEAFINSEKMSPEWYDRRFQFNDFLDKHYYGSADNIEQVLEHGKKFIDSSDPYVLEVNLLTPETHPGWRWHKNGPYIGKHENLCEHLGESPEIKEIIVFHFYLLKKKTRT